jgi:pyruvate,orthophosphate dikinase
MTDNLTLPRNARAAEDALVLLERVERGDVDVGAALASVTETQLRALVAGTLEDRPNALLAKGESRAPGLAVGVLALSRVSAEQFADSGVPYVLAVDAADVTDFETIRKCAGFVTSSPAQTAFGPVQAVSCGKPTLVGVSYAGHHQNVDFTLPSGQTKTLAEGDWVALDGVTGALYEGRLERSLTPIAEYYELAWRIVVEAVRSGRAEGHVAALREFSRLAGESPLGERIALLAGDPALRGYWMVLDEAKRRARVEVWSTAHTPEGIGRAQLAKASVRFDGLAIPEFVVDEVRVGLMRDERMWSGAEEQDVLRLVILGPDAVRDSDWQDTIRSYVDIHATRLTELFAEARGGLVVLRALCMPYAKLFTAERDVDRLAARCSVGRDALAGIVAGMNEKEMYQGCRGMRLLTQRPDIAKLWLVAAATALRNVARSGTPTRLRILLPTITLPEEARRFLSVLDQVFPDVLGADYLELLDGVSIMVETTGAYLLLEDFLTVSSTVTAVDGGMIGSNDFTAACFTVNREDSTRTIFPGYVREGVLPASPFAELDTTLVGPAILDTLDRARATSRSALMGLGGELAGDWASVRWLADNTADRGFTYVTTGPETVLRAIFASASTD